MLTYVPGSQTENIILLSFSNQKYGLYLHEYTLFKTRQEFFSHSIIIEDCNKQNISKAILILISGLNL
jgi:hypothetical protein